MPLWLVQFVINLAVLEHNFGCQNSSLLKALILGSKGLGDLVLEIEYNDSRRFWTSIRKLMGGKMPPVPYLKIQKIEKIQECKEKFELFREILTQIFQITDAENQDFDMDYEETVIQFTENNGEITQMLSNIYLNRLDPSNYSANRHEHGKDNVKKKFQIQRAWKIQNQQKTVRETTRELLTILYKYD